MKKFLFIFILSMAFNNAQSIETKIIHKIQNEIITNIDIKNEFKYLIALNNKLEKLNKEKILIISNESAIREKIKKIEILKNFKEIKIKSEYLNALLKNIYTRLNLDSLEKFEIYLKNYDLTLYDVKKKITIDALWNELIVQKYSSKITIDRIQLKKEILKNNNNKLKNFKLSEIIFEIKNKEEIEKKYKEIIKSVTEIGFENSASIYSFSKSSKSGGDIGWVSEKSLNSKILENIKYLKKGEISKPIILPNGVLLLKIINIKTSELKIDLDKEFEKAIRYEQNRQLNQYSNIYYNKIKKDLEFDE
jgi:peptidyl-prolyl cis-trans isomerase SurA